MNKYSHLLAALLLAGAAGGYAACGDSDDGDSTGRPDAGDRDSGSEEETDDEDAEVDGNDDAGTGGGSDGGGSSEKPPEEIDDCPAHPAVTAMGDYCRISASLGSEIKTDLELKPVKGKKGYQINQGVFVGEDVGGKASPDTSKKSATLTISKGVTLYGADALSFLLVNRGSKLIAEGTKNYPIVFTSGASGANRPGRWGGLIINGRAPSNKADANGDVAGEAGTGKYSGPDTEDNSGVVKYVRIEFGGGKIDNMNELNGLALQGVGGKTVIDYVHIHANDDDGIEFFGGTVDAKHIIVTGAADDGIDWTDGWVGRMQFAIVQQWKYTNPGSGADDAANGIEADSNSTTTRTPISDPVLSNITMIGDTSVTNRAHGLILRRGTKGKFHNFLVLSFKENCISLRGTACAGYAGSDLTFNDSRLYCSTNYDSTSRAGTAEAADGPAAMSAFASGSGNMELANGSSSLEDPSNQEKNGNFRPKDSKLLTGGKTPSDSFFEKVEFIGALGDDEDKDWTAGEWFKVTPFSG
jgi:hypothetical protein